MSDLTGDTATPATTAVLTGATSGIGEHVARHLAGTIDTLIVHGPEPEAEVTDVLAGFRGQRAIVHYVRADFADLDQVRAAAARIRELAEHIDLLINNAGTPAPRPGSWPSTGANGPCRSTIWR